MAATFLFDEIIFDTDVIKGLSPDAALAGWPAFANTTIQNPATGNAQVNVNRLDARERVVADLEGLTPEQSAYLMKMWRGGYGNAVGFRWLVLWDYTATLEGFGTGNGANTQWALKRTYRRPGVTAREDVRQIIKPVVQVAKETNGFQLYEADGVTPRTPAQPLTIYVNSVEQTSGWTVNAKTGVVTFAAAPANGAVLQWSGQFDVPMRFRDNELSQQTDTVANVRQVVFEEILPVELGLSLLDLGVI
jgi:hypothetical protein